MLGLLHGLLIVLVFRRLSVFPRRDQRWATRSFNLVCDIVTYRMMRNTVAACVALACVLSTAPAAQAPLATVAGQVVEADSDYGLSEVRVTLRGGGGDRQATTDARGRFTIASVPPGTWSLRAARTGYLGGAYEQRTPLGLDVPLDVRGSEQLTVVLRLWKTVAVAGRVQDDAGEPLVGAPVRALRPVDVAGRTRWVTMGVGRSNDKGAYRLFGLPPGTYVIAASTTDSLDSSPPRAVGAVTQFFNRAATIRTATVLELSSGDERVGIDFAVEARDTFTVSGQLGPGRERADGDLAATEVLLVPAELDQDSDVPSAKASLDAEGQFRFRGIRPGTYLLRAFVPPIVTGQPSLFQTGDGTNWARSASSLPTATLAEPLKFGNAWWAEERIEIGDRNPDPIQLFLRPAARFNGRVVVEGTQGTATAGLEMLAVAVESADGRPLGTLPAGPVLPDGRFETSPLSPGKYLLRLVGPNSKWQVKSLRADGVGELVDRPLDLGGTDISVSIVLTDRLPASLTGHVSNPNGGAAAGSFVRVFPTNPAMWTDFGRLPRQFRTVRASRDGEYRLVGLPAGTYYLRADSDAPEAWLTVDKLGVLMRGATEIKLGESEQRRVDLRLQSAR